MASLGINNTNTNPYSTQGLLRSNRADIRHHPKDLRLVPQSHHLFALRLSALRCVTMSSFHSVLPDRSSTPGNACSTAFAHTPVRGGNSTDPVPRAHQRSGRTHGFTGSQPECCTELGERVQRGSPGSPIGVSEGRHYVRRLFPESWSRVAPALTGVHAWSLRFPVFKRVTDSP
ncbi:hypothetical protein K505DRAFT_329822 [Melanomma pulvis-pyrius CBS 109.77]|uniref:Uncharacterized protein n=1 Tax=Melanomma pulvis-pyrius CBS 109.77 TaxID=1314802 RepID=A0A6A6WSW4_9PLEO|nr:hypothetical protein K505DRAFT_329822 [Melanomma pulvis-pyrius CBS 109.77]